MTFFVTWFDPNTYVAGERKEGVKEAFYPVYLICHSSFAIVLWLALALASRVKGDDDDVWYRRSAGLDSVPALDSTTLQLHLLNGNDNRLEMWRILTYQFTHVNYRHVLRNIALILLFGIPQEGLHGHWRIALIFNSGVLGGAFLYMITDCHAECVGMSGGCYTLIGVKLANLLLLWTVKTQRFRKLQLAFVLFIVAVDTVCAQLDIANSDGPRPSFSLHIGGVITGLMVGAICGWSIVEKHLTRTRFRIIVCIFLLVILFGIAWTIKWPPQTIFESQGWGWAKRVRSAAVFGDLHWHCVRCGSEECIDAWSDLQYVHDTTIQWCDHNGGWKFTEDWPGK